METDLILTAIVLTATLGFLIQGRLAAEYVLLAALACLILGDVLTVSEALSGFANESVATIAILFVVAHSLSSSGLLSRLAQTLLGKPKSLFSAQIRLMLPIALFSSVLNNTPVVAMTIPLVSDWCRRYKLPISKLMIPLSFAAIIGGVCTVIGTSTNLVINDMLLQETGESLALFDLAWVGLPCAVVTIVFILVTSKWLLPNKKGVSSRFEDTRQYTVEMLVEPGGLLVGKTVEEANLRGLPGLYLVEIVRSDEVITIVGPRRVLQANDRLVFAGNVDAVVDLKKIAGLVSAEDQVFKLSDNGNRSLVEVVISNDYPLLKQTVKASNFRYYYGAVIIAVSRAGQRINKRFGDLILKPGDTLLLETNNQFVSKQKFVRDFLVVSPVTDFLPPKSSARWYALGALMFMLVSVGVGFLSLFESAAVGVIIMMLSRSITIRSARKSIDTSVLLVIASSIGLGMAMQKSGLALLIADVVLSPFSHSPMASLVVIFTLTALFSSVVSNVAAAVLLFPVAALTANALGVSVIPFAVAIMVAASTSFSTPIGYQTNLMVYGPGGYNFIDFVRIGLPLTIVVGFVSVLIIPQVWSF